MTAPSSRTAAAPRRTARDRLLDAADELFYAEGIHTVGIDRVIERAGVAKASLYATFGSKDELVRAYLGRRHDTRQQRFAAELARHSDPVDRLLSLFDALALSIATAGYHGCAFMNASAEAEPGSAAAVAVGEYRRWWRQGLLVDLAREAGAPDPESLARQLGMLYDGASLSARLDADPEAARTAKAAAEVLVADLRSPTS